MERRFINDIVTGNVTGCYLVNDNLSDLPLIEPFAEPNYRLVSDTKNSLEPAAWTTVALIAVISAKIPGAGATAVSTLAKKVISDGGRDYSYRLRIYTASDGKFFYQKNVFSIYNNETNKQVGNDLTTKIKTRQK